MIDGKEIPDALHVPRQAVFEKNGKTHVFVKVGDRFEQREVKVEQRTESRAVIAGLPEGTEVALVDPTARAASDLQQQLADAPGGRRLAMSHGRDPHHRARRRTSCPSCGSGSRTCARTSCDRC